MYQQFNLFDEPKRCSKCGEYKPLSEYYRRNTSPCGYKPDCKSCQAAYYQANKDRIREQKRAYVHANVEKVRERKRKYNRENWAALYEKMKAWRARNPERARELQRASQKRNPEKKRESVRRYQARKAGATVTPVDYAAILERYGMWCHICGGAIEGDGDLHMDHVVPLIRGGTHSADNIRPAHATCNVRKHAKLMEELDFA